MLALKLAERLDVPKKTAEDFVHAFQDIVTQTLASDEDVTIAGFGTFSSRIRAARKGVNPRNPSQTIDVPAVKVPKFKAGKALKDSLKASMHKPTASTKMEAPANNAPAATPPPAPPAATDEPATAVPPPSGPPSAPPSPPQFGGSATE